MRDIFTNIVGYTAAVVGPCLMLPQIIKSYRSKKTGDLSLTMVIVYDINCFLWLAYGFLISATPLAFSSGIGFVIGIVQLVLKIKYNNH